MIGKKYDKFFYFRTVADEDDDDNSVDSIMLPVSRITGVLPGGVAFTETRTKVIIYFDSSTQQVLNFNQDLTSGGYGHILLNINTDTSKDVIKAIVNAAGPNGPSDPVIVIADDTTVDVDGSVRPPKYIHKDILDVSGLVFNRYI
jgi:hypothetical protein